jgi:hypothetical protein
LDSFAFFSKPNLDLSLSLNRYRPVPSQWHDQGKECNILSARLFNKGKTAHILEATITVIDLLRGEENLHWNMPTHDPNPSLTLKQLPKWAHANLSIAYIIPQQRLWKLETAESSFLTNPHIYQNDKRYTVGVKISHEPSRLDGWTFTLTLHGNGEATQSNVKKLDLKT